MCSYLWWGIFFIKKTKDTIASDLPLKLKNIVFLNFSVFGEEAFVDEEGNYLGKYILKQISSLVRILAVWKLKNSCPKSTCGEQVSKLIK